MKKLTTLLCCVSLMICGVSLAMYEKGNPLTHATLTAATTYTVPKFTVDEVRSLLPLDIRLDQEKASKPADTLETTNQSVSEVTKVDNHVVKAPMVIERTIEVPVLYIATPVSQPDSVPYKYDVHRVSDDDVGISEPISLDVESYEE